MDALIDGLRRGDAAAFDQAYSLYQARVYSFLYRLCGRRELAEDLAQETWLKLARSAHALRADTQLKAWLLTVARNALRSHRRWSIVRARPPEDPRTPRRPDEEAEARRTLSALERALLALPEAHREVLLLVGVEGLDQPQAAAVLGISYDALRQRLSRARALLEEKMADVAA